MSDDENLLDEKVHRPPAEIGREVRRLAEQHGAVRVEIGEHDWDVAIYPADEE